MNGTEAAFWAFMGSAFLFGYLSMREARHVKSVHAFFYDNRVSLNVLSYMAANITLGTGAVSYLTESIHGAGSPQAQKIMITRLADMESSKAAAKRLCGIK